MVEKSLSIDAPSQNNDTFTEGTNSNERLLTDYTSIKEILLTEDSNRNEILVKDATSKMKWLPTESTALHTSSISNSEDQSKLRKVLIEDIANLMKEDEGIIDKVVNGLKTLSDEDNNDKNMSILESMVAFDFLLAKAIDVTMIEEENENKIKNKLKAYFEDFIEKNKAIIENSMKLVRKILIISELYFKKNPVFGKEVHEKYRNFLFDKLLKKLKIIKEEICWDKLRTREDKFLLSLSANMVSDCIEGLLKFAEYKKETFIDAIIAGRFDKSDTGLKDPNGSIILGDSGGIFYLINGYIADPNDSTIEMLKEDKIKEKFLKNKEIPKSKGNDNNKKNIVIGEGAIGVVRLALSLSKLKPPHRNLEWGKVLCVKKFRKEKHLSENIFLTLNEYQKNVFEDKVHEDVSFHRPLIYEIAFTWSKQGERKGYLFMDVIPQNDAKFYFSKPEYQRLEYQMPYMLSLIEVSKKLLEREYYHFDLKPANTLFDPYSNKLTIIDLGGIMSISKKFITRNFYIEGVYRYYSPELKEFISNNCQGPEISFEKCFTFACGVTFDTIRNKEGNCPEIESLIKNMTNSDPVSRFSLDEAFNAITDLKKLAPSYQVRTIEDYIRKLSKTINRDASILGLNKTVNRDRFTIKQRVTAENPKKYNNNEAAIDINEAHKKFIHDESKKIFVLQGAPRSGKSFFIQNKLKEEVFEFRAELKKKKKFNEIAKNLNEQFTLPLYMKLIEKVYDLYDYLKIINQNIGSNLRVEDLKEYKLHIFIEHCDYVLKRGIAPILNMFKDLKVKIILGFQHTSKIGKEKEIKECLIRYHLVPFDYFEFKSGFHYKKEKSMNLLQNVESLAAEYIEYSKKRNLNMNLRPEEILKKFEDLNLLKNFKKCENIFFLLKNNIFEGKENFNDIIEVLQKIIEQKISYEIRKLNSNQKSKMLKFFDIKNNSPNNLLLPIMEFGTSIFIKELISSQENKSLEKYLDSLNSNYIKNELEIESDKPKLYFSKRSIFSKIFQILSIKIKNNFTVDCYEIELKNFFQYRYLKKEFKLQSDSEHVAVLATLDLKANKDLISKITKLGDMNILNGLRGIVSLGCDTDNEILIRASSNSLTILARSKFSFSNHNLNKLTNSKSNLQGGLFYKTSFEGSCFKETNMKNVSMIRANFKGAKLEQNEIDDHKAIPPLNPKVSYSSKFILLSNGDDLIVTCKTTDDNLFKYNLTGETYTKPWKTKAILKQIAYNPEKKMVAGVVKKKKGCIKIFQSSTSSSIEVKDAINNIEFSPDSKFIAAAIENGRILIWDLEFWPKLGDPFVLSLQNSPHDHSNMLFKVVYSPKGKFLGAGAYLWETNLLQPDKFINFHPQLNLEPQITELLFTPKESKLIYSLESPNKQCVCIYSIKQRKVKYEIRTIDTPVSCMAINGTGDILAIGSKTSLIALHNLKEKFMIQYLKLHSNKIKCLQFGFKTEKLISGSKDNIVIWSGITASYRTKQVKLSFPQIECMAFDNNKGLLAFVGRDSSLIAFLKIPESKIMKRYPCYFPYEKQENKINSIAFTKDGLYLVVGTFKGDVLKIPIDGEEKENLETFKNKIIKVETTDKGNVIWLGDILKVRRNGNTTKVNEKNPKILNFASRPSDETIAYLIDLNNGEIEICIVSGFKKHNEIRIQSNSSGVIAKAMLFNEPNELKNLICFEEEYECLLNIVDLDKNEIKAIKQAHNKPILSMVFIDILILATASEDKNIKIWQINKESCDAEAINTIEGHSDRVTCLLFDKKENRLISGSFDNSIKIWSFKSNDYKNESLVYCFGIKEILCKIEDFSGGKYPERTKQQLMNISRKLN